ncbi:hypothetical protein AOLI_G00151130 [Acnodon oligacanthus]
MCLGTDEGLKRHAVASLSPSTQPIYCLTTGPYLSNRKKMSWVGESFQKIKSKLVSSLGSGRKHSASGDLLSSSRSCRCLGVSSIHKWSKQTTSRLSAAAQASFVIREKGEVDLKVFFLNQK